MRIDVGGYAYIIRRLPIVTDYERQQEQKAQRLYKIQKALMIIGLIIICTLLSLLSTELIIPMAIAALLGTVAILTNNI